ncbi:hypothetical protein B0H16DRAFT_950570 [Mycena metata]|uniref:Uncharacterized protein n=1 Tax=Mycena metata TaxID=1033252 RepID=A0AAD7K2Y4_9AGAR|nr:hypothetical protein B0H16DRAFT_950570 [Mycena metata]
MRALRGFCGLAQFVGDMAVPVTSVRRVYPLSAYHSGVDCHLLNPPGPRPTTCHSVGTRGQHAHIIQLITSRSCPTAATGCRLRGLRVL